MQNKGAIRALAIIFAVIFLYQLSFTVVTNSVERKAKKYAQNEESANLAKTLAKGDESMYNHLLDSIQDSRENYYLDSVSNVVVYNILIDKYTYREAKEKEINLGLDLKGGMNVTLEVSVKDIVNALSGNSQDPVFVEAMRKATERQAKSEGDFVTLFGEAFAETDPNAKLASIFLYEFKDKGITVNSTNNEVLKVLRSESDGAIDRSYQILRTRIDRFGVAQPNIQKMENTGRILVELPGIKDAQRVRKLLQGTAQLEFWETYNFNELAQYFNDANEKLAEKVKAEKGVKSEPVVADSTATEEGSLEQLVSEEESAESDDISALKESAPLYAYLQPSFFQDGNGQILAGQTARVGIAQVKDTATINSMLKETRSLFPRTVRFAWSVKPERTDDGKEFLDLVALKMSRDNKAALGGEVIVDARQDYSQNNQVEVTIQMNSEGAKAWKRLTGENIGRQIAIVLDNYVYSYPVVNDEIPSGRSSISGGSMTINEAQDLANILKAGKLPAPARILEEQIVGPSLGRESVEKGMWSMIFAFILVLVYMVFFYKKSGIVADTALLVNVFFLFGVLASLGSVLTLPGIAGIVLTLGMAVDSNVIIFERVKEEIRAGKSIRLAIEDGYKNAYSAIIDGNVTTLITAIILIILGTGPVHSFAVTLCIGILTSLFTSIFITRLIFVRMLDNNKEISFASKLTNNFLQNTQYNFIGMRKTAYIIAAAFVLVCAGSLAFKGLNLGIDFKGGRNYIVRFDKDVPVGEIRQALAAIPEFEDNIPEVKTYGPNRQVKITTKYKIDVDGAEVDTEIQELFYNGLKGFYKNPMTYEAFSTDSNKADASLGIVSSQKVGATIASDVTRKAFVAVLVSLAMMFVYIAIRFRKWQYGLSSLLALTHDTILVLGMYSLFSNILPFSMEIDQSFIAAVLTVIGYSINATVVIFDRIRENNTLFPKRSWKENLNNAVNSTLARSFNTSGSTMVVLLAIFIFGGESIRGFIFALLVGIIAGTFSSVFLSSSFAYTLLGAKKKDEEKEAAAITKKK